MSEYERDAETDVFRTGDTAHRRTTYSLQLAIRSAAQHRDCMQVCLTFIKKNWALSAQKSDAVINERVALGMPGSSVIIVTKLRTPAEERDIFFNWSNLFHPQKQTVYRHPSTFCSLQLQICCTAFSFSFLQNFCTLSTQVFSDIPLRLFPLVLSYQTNLG
jgi:hypothetical protein